MVDGDIGFSATIEQCLVIASCTTQYCAIASAGETRTGETRAADIIPIANGFRIGLFRSSRLKLLWRRGGSYHAFG